MRVFSTALAAVMLLIGSLVPASASGIRQVSYTAAYEFAKDPGSDHVFAICDMCFPVKRLAVKSKPVHLVLKVAVPIATAPKDVVIRNEDKRKEVRRNDYGKRE